MRSRHANLIQRLQDGDPSCFHDIIAWYADDVLRLCYELLWDAEEAKDVLQETLLRFVQTVQKGRLRSENGSIKGLLMTTARNLCINRLRRTVRFRPLGETDATLNVHLQDVRTPDCAAADFQFEEAFEVALSQLTDAQRIVLVLHKLNGESQRTIAGTLGCSVDCVKAHLARARKKMRVLLQPFLE